MFVSLHVAEAVNQWLHTKGQDALRYVNFVVPTLPAPPALIKAIN